MANPLISGTFAGLTNVNVRGVQDTITDSVDQFNWEFAWKKFKMDNPNYKVNDSDIPTLCKQLSKNQVDVLFKNAVNNAKFEVVKIVTEKVTPHLDTLAKGATDAGAAVMDAFGEARDAAAWTDGGGDNVEALPRSGSVADGRGSGMGMHVLRCRYVLSR